VARWLDIIPPDWVGDNRNAKAGLQARVERDDPEGVVLQSACDDAVQALRDIELPDADGLKGEPWIHDFVGVQPYQLAYYGEKNSLFDILDPIARNNGLDLVLTKGDTTDTRIRELAAAAAADPHGRPLKVGFLSDSDMSGWQMAVVLFRKLQALKLTAFPELEFEVYRIGLRPDQVKQLNLPQEPLKPRDKRGPKWLEDTGTRATELDALITRQPNVLRRMARDFVRLFQDPTLDARVRETRTAWITEVTEIIAAREDLVEVRRAAAERLAEIQEVIAELADEIEEIAASVTAGVELPELPEIPEAEVDEDAWPQPVCSTDWSFRVQTIMLLYSKGYGEVKEGADPEDMLYRAMTNQVTDDEIDELGKLAQEAEADDE